MFRTLIYPSSGAFDCVVELPETCRAHKKWNKIASDIKLVFHSSTITMIHSPTNIRSKSNLFSTLTSYGEFKWLRKIQGFLQAQRQYLIYDLANMRHGISNACKCPTTTAGSQQSSSLSYKRNTAPNHIANRMQSAFFTHTHTHTHKIIIIIIFINRNWVVTSGSGYFTCIQNMKLVTNKFKSGGLHEKHVVATWNVGNHLSICL